MLQSRKKAVIVVVSFGISNVAVLSQAKGKEICFLSAWYVFDYKSNIFHEITAILVGENAALSPNWQQKALILGLYSLRNYLYSS